MSGRVSGEDGYLSLLLRYGHFLFRYRNAVFPLVAGALLALFSPVFAFGTRASDMWLDVVGVLIVLCGGGLRIAVVGLRYIKRGGLDKRIYADTLVTEGLFAHSRNPLYLGNLLILLGLFVVHNNPWVYALGGGFFLLSYYAIVVAEERYLEGKFGDAYAAYRAHTPRFLIAFKGIGRTLTGMGFNWRRVLAKETSTIHSWSLFLLLLFGYEAVTARGLSDAGDTLIILAAIEVMVAATHLALRHLKKSGRFRENPPEERVDYQCRSDLPRME